MMTWRERTDLWYGRLLLRPIQGSETVQFGGAYVAFAVVAEGVQEALEHLVAAVANHSWQVTSIATMKRSWDYHDDTDEDDVIEQGPNWLGLVEQVDRVGVSLGPIDTFRIDRRPN